MRPIYNSRPSTQDKEKKDILDCIQRQSWIVLPPWCVLILGWANYHKLSYCVRINEVCVVVYLIILVYDEFVFVREESQNNNNKICARLRFLFININKNMNFIIYLLQKQQLQQKPQPCDMNELIQEVNIVVFCMFIIQIERNFMPSFVRLSTTETYIRISETTANNDTERETKAKGKK